MNSNYEQNLQPKKKRKYEIQTAKWIFIPAKGTKSPAFQFHSLKTHLQARNERRRIRRRFNSSKTKVEIQFLADEMQVALPTPRSQCLQSQNATSKWNRRDVEATVGSSGDSTPRKRKLRSDEDKSGLVTGEVSTITSSDVISTSV